MCCEKDNISQGQWKDCRPEILFKYALLPIYFDDWCLYAWSHGTGLSTSIVSHNIYFLVSISFRFLLRYLQIKSISIKCYRRCWLEAIMSMSSVISATGESRNVDAFMICIWWKCSFSVKWKSWNNWKLYQYSMCVYCIKVNNIYGSKLNFKKSSLS